MRIRKFNSIALHILSVLSLSATLLFADDLPTVAILATGGTIADAGINKNK